MAEIMSEAELEATTQEHADQAVNDSATDRSTVPEEQAASEPVEETTEVKTDEEPGEEERPDGVQKRINQLTARAKSSEEREKAALEQADKLRRELALRAAQDPLQRFEETKPRYAQFGDEAQYEAALDKWNAAKIQMQARAQQSAMQQVEDAKNFQQTMGVGRGKYADFEAVVNSPTLPPLAKVAPVAFRELIRSDVGADIAYEIAKSPQKIFDLAQKDEISQARAIWEIAANIKAEPKPQEPSTDVPSAIPTGAGYAPKSMDDMTDEEFVAERRKQIAAKANSFLR